MGLKQNRERFPEVAKFVDLVRASFPEAKVAYCSENGYTVGKKRAKGVVPRRWVPMPTKKRRGR